MLRAGAPVVTGDADHLHALHVPCKRADQLRDCIGAGTDRLVQHALVDEVRRAVLPDSTLKGTANLLVMPTVDAANISYNLLRVSASDGVTIGPILMGMSKSAHVLTPISSVRRIVNMVAVAAVSAQRHSKK